MPFSTSPYQNNDYQAASSYRPYRLPVNDIVKGLAAQDAFWDEGARRVKSYYDNALELNLTSNENKEVRKQFMEDADKQIAKLSSMNVADPSVQRQGMGIFKPLFQDEGIIYDDFLTKKQGQIFSEAERYKRDEKTKGEGYHQDNLMYALKPFQGFNSETKRGDLKGIYERAKNAEYIPYHDVSKEYLDLASKCNPDKITSNSIQGLYFEESSSKGLSSDKINGCIKAGLSDKGWQQLRITGSVRYGDNYQAIAQGYSDIIRGNSKSYSNTLLNLAAERKKLKESGSFTPEMEQAYNETEGAIKSRMASDLVSLNKLSSGDYSDIEKNYDNIVAQVYANQDIGGFAQAFAHADETHKFSANAAGIAQMRESGENARFSTRLQFDANKFQIEQQQKSKENDIKLLQTLMGNGKDSGLRGMGMNYETFLKFIKPIGDRLGIDLENTNSYMNEGTETTTGQTYEDIKQKADQFHHERVQTVLGMENVLKGLVDESILKGAYNEKGQLNHEKLFEIANEYLNTFHKTKGNNAQYAKKLDDIKDLENLTNNYVNSRAKVFEFMKLRDDINAKIDASPELRKNLNESNMAIDNYFSSGKASKTAIIQYDQNQNQAIILYPNDLNNIAKGGHPLYKIKDGQIVSKITGVPLIAKVPKDKGEYLAAQAKSKGFNVGETGNLNIFSIKDWIGSEKDILIKMNELNNNRNKKVSNQLGTIIHSVVRNSMEYGVGSTPGLANTFKQQFGAILPKFNSEEYEFRPGVAYKDANGVPVTTVQVFKKTKEKNDSDVTVNSEKDVTSDVIEALKSSPYSVGGSNNINVQNGRLTIATPYLPMFKNENPLNEVISNQVYAANKANLGYMEKISSELKIIPGSGGFRIGFDVIGGGTSASGNKNPNQYRTWVLTPSGEKEYIGDDIYAENQIGNQLLVIENNIGAIVDSYEKSKKK